MGTPMNTPKARRPNQAESSSPSVMHPSMAKKGGDARGPIRDTRVAGLEESVSELFHQMRGQKEKTDDSNKQMNSMYQDVLNLSMRWQWRAHKSRKRGFLARLPKMNWPLRERDGNRLLTQRFVPTNWRSKVSRGCERWKIRC